jgi:tetratricopeptide (TPR) repeat protein
MATSNFLKNRKNRILITAIIIVICAFVTFYYATIPQDTTLNIFGWRVSVESSRSTIIFIAVLFGLVGSFFVNIFSGDIHETLKEDTPAERKEPKVIVPEIKIENVFPPRIETKQSKPVPSSNQKFLPTPFLPDLKFFVGREDILQKIKDTHAKDHKAAIHDISGLGKTFTTYKYAEQNQNAYDKIFLVRATKEEMLESLAKCGEAVNPDLVELQEQQAKAFGFKQWLEENDKWLVIYDNVDLPGELFPFVPTLLKGDCLFTSNFPEVENLGTVIDIKKFNKTDAEILLYSRYINQPHSIPDLSGEEKEAFDNIIEEIDGLPLTLNSTGAFILKKKWKFKRFWEEYEETPEIAWESADDYSVYQRKSAGIVFSLVYDELCATENVGTAVKALLSAMTFLSPDEIPENLLQEILRNQDKSLKKIKNFDNFWDDLRNTITGYDLLKYNINKELFTTHRSIQRVIQTKIKPAEKKAICERLVALFLDLFPIYDYSNKEACERYYLHVQTLLENSDKLQIERKNINNLYFRVGRYQRLLANYAQAEIFNRRAVEISAKVYGDESIEHATDLNNLANVYFLQDRPDEAIEKYEEALQIEEKTIGKEHPDYAIGLNNLGDVYYSLRRYDEAIEKYEEVLRITEKTIGKERLEYAIRLNNLVLVYELQGRGEEAVEKFEEALSINEKAIDKEHPDYATLLNNQALTYEAQGRYDDAIEKYEEALRIYVKVLDENHPFTQTVKGNLESCRKK